MKVLKWVSLVIVLGLLIAVGINTSVAHDGETGSVSLSVSYTGTGATVGNALSATADGTSAAISWTVDKASGFMTSSPAPVN